MRRGFDLFLLAAAALLVWQGLHWLMGDIALSSPGETLKKLAAIVAMPGFSAHAWETGRAFLLSLLISVPGGVGIGALLGLSRASGNIAQPILLVLYSLPKVTLYPLVLLIFGLGMSAKVAFGAMHGVIPVAILTMNAVMNLKPVYLRSAGVMRLTPWQTLSTVVVPAVMPEVIAGARLGFSLSLLGVLIGEMFASRQGIGFLIMNAMNLGDIATIMALAVLLSVFAIAGNAALLLLDRKVAH